MIVAADILHCVSELPLPKLENRTVLNRMAKIT